ncbi:MAG: 2-keto-4-pentenoate hydratase [Alphaproteobacteria bacterium]
MIALFALPILALALSVPPAQARACDADRIVQMTAAYVNKRPVKTLGPELTMGEALCAQTALVARLSRELGRPIGYKVGLTSKAAREMFGATTPAHGVLLEAMLLPDGAEVPVDYGIRPIFEPDLLVTVKDAGVNDAKTPLEAARHLEAVIPFVELADLTMAEGEPLSLEMITAINVGARLGVAGQPVPISPGVDFVDALATMTVITTDASGNQLSKASGEAVLGHPLNAVIWLAGHLAESRVKLKAGDMISLGAFARPLPPQPGETVTVRYEGLPTGPMQVSVTFR